MSCNLRNTTLTVSVARAKKWVSPSEISRLDTGCIHGHIKTFIEDQLATVIQKLQPPDTPSSKADGSRCRVCG